MVARGRVREMNLQSTEDLGLSSLSGMPLCVCVCVCVCVSWSVVSDSLQPHGPHSLPGSSVQGILWAKILESVAIPFPGWNVFIFPLFLKHSLTGYRIYS